MFSIPKLLVLGLIIFVVLYGFKVVGSLNRRRAKDERPEPRQAARREREREKLEAEDLVKCPRCGAYVSPGGDHECRRQA